MAYKFNPFTGNFDESSSASPGGSDTQVQFNDGGSFAGATGVTFDKSLSALTLSGVQFSLSGNFSAASWGLNGLKLKGGTSTLTDTSAAGTVATGATNVLGGNTIAATNARTITDYYSAYINGPVAGTNVTLTNRWALGLAAPMQIAAGTFTAAQSAMNISQTWNASGVTFTGLKFNVTDTASAAGSLLMDLQVGGASKFKVDKAGIATTGTGGGFKADLSSAGIGYEAKWGASFTIATIASTDGNGYVTVSSDGAFRFSNAQLGVTNPDLFIRRDAANTLAQRNSTNAQTFRLYNTYTDASNYERGFLTWDTNVLKIGTEKDGSGSARNLELQADGTTRLTVGTAGTSVTGTFVLNGAKLFFNTGGDRGSINVPSNGVFTLQDAAETSFGRLQFGGTTSSFPAIKRSTTALQVRLADDSAFTGIESSLVNVYAAHTSDTNYQRCGIKTAKTTLSNVSGASVTASSLIPAGAFLIGVTSRVNTALGTGNGTTGYQVGTASDPDLWGAITGTAEGTASGSANYTAPGASGLFTEATNVIVTAVGGNFNATGVIELAIHYLLTEAD